MPNRKRRRMIIRTKRKLRAKRKVAEGCTKVVDHKGGRRKVRFEKSEEA